MKWVSFRRYVSINPELGRGFTEGTKLLFTEQEISELDRNPYCFSTWRQCVEFSEVDESKIYKGGDLPRGTKVGFYYPAAIGDAACHTSIVCVLKYRYPEATFRVFASEYTAPIWYANPWIDDSCARPNIITPDAFNECDVWLIGDAVVYNLTNPDQPNIYDVLSDHFHVPLAFEEKRPFLFIAREEIAKFFEKLNKSSKVDLRSENILTFAPLARVENRSWPKSHKFMTSANRWAEVVNGAGNMGYEVIHLLEQGIFSTREMMILAKISDRVITVDSAMVHLAAAFQKKTIAIFGPFSPTMRSTTYPNCISLWAKSECILAPCCDHNEFPKDCPSRWKGSCDVLERVEGKDVLKVLVAMEENTFGMEALAGI